MKKASKKATKKTPSTAAVGQQYEDYLTLKQKEQEETAMMEAMMEQAEEVAMEDSYAHLDPVGYPPDTPPVGNGISSGYSGEFYESPPTGNVKAFRAKKSPAPVKAPAPVPPPQPVKKRVTAQSRPVFADPGDELPVERIADIRQGQGRNARTLNSGMGIGSIGRGSTAGNYARYGATNYMEPVARTEMEEVKALPELEAAEATIPSDIEQFDEVRTALRIVRQPECTLVYCIVVDKQNEKNVVAGLRCYGGVAFGGYARDVSGDAYLVECVQAVHLGSVPFSFRLEMPKAGTWNVDIPIPEKVLEAAFAPAQRKTLADLRERFPDDRFEFHYLQMLVAN